MQFYLVLAYNNTISWPPSENSLLHYYASAELPQNNVKTAYDRLSCCLNVMTAPTHSSPPKPPHGLEINVTFPDNEAVFSMKIAWERSSARNRNIACRLEA